MKLSERNKRLEDQLKSVAEIYYDFQKGLSDSFWSSIEEYINDADWFVYFIVGYNVSYDYVLDSVLYYYWKLLKLV